MTLARLTSFSHIKKLRNMCKRLYYSQSFGGISFHVMAKNWQHLKEILGLSSFFVNRVLLTSGLLPNLSLVVGQSSVNISLGLALVKYPLHD